LVTGFEDKSESGIYAYPNPFTKTFALKNDTGSVIEASLLNYSGQETFYIRMDPGSSANIGGELPVGMYILKVNQSGKYSNVKLIKN
jgi:hypothetical protein